MEQRPPSVPKLAWVEEDEGGPGAAPGQETEEVVPFHPPQEDAAVERTQEQQSSRGRFRRTAQLVCDFIKSVRQEEARAMGAGLRAHSEVLKYETSAALLDLLVENGASKPEQVPAMVRYIHQWLLANDSAEHRLDKTLLNLTKAHPDDAVMTLLRVAPSCDRAAWTMWKTIMGSSRTAELAQLVLLDVLGNWPEHSTCTSDGDKTGVFALAATVVMWKILQVRCVPRIMKVYFPRLFVHLLFQVFFSTLDMPEEVDTFWKGCQEEHGLATSPNRFAVRTLKSLLCQRQYKDVVVAMERRGVWNTLLCDDTRHYAVGLLAREMRHARLELCSSIALHLLQLLSREEPRWDLAALAFIVEVLECLDYSECADSVVEVSSRYLQSECRERRRLALRALLELIHNPSMADKMWRLTESLMDLLWDNDAEIAGMTLVALSFIFWRKYSLMSSPIVLQLAEALLPLFDHDNSQVQLLSIKLFRDMMEVLEEREKPLERLVHQSLLPLFFHCHDESQHVAEASRETLLCAARFLKRRDIKKLVKEEKLWKFSKCLLAEDTSRAAEQLRRALRYLESPQEPLREAAIRFMGVAGQHLRGNMEELLMIYSALEDRANDVSLAVGSLAIQSLCILRSAEWAPVSRFQRLQNQLRRMWKARPRLSCLRRLSCWSSVEM
ncbi:maestro heat-like repeat-containing protein family member 6 isoform X1 [Passer domesticus]|uniref:maestro heat-like repeat-containing protein family member 6 isoform X1 n=1 Tax=Passer domesticus TaxID=48849 RepID=UPI0030FE9618